MKDKNLTDQKMLTAKSKLCAILSLPESASDEEIFLSVNKMPKNKLQLMQKELNNFFNSIK